MPDAYQKIKDKPTINCHFYDTHFLPFENWDFRLKIPFSFLSVAGWNKFRLPEETLLEPQGS